MSEVRSLAVVLVALVAIAACKAKAPDPTPQPEIAPAIDAGVTVDAAVAWSELKELPAVAPVHVTRIPTQPKVPRFEVVGPVVVGDLAIVGSSQFGFAAVDWRSGAIAWTKAAGAHVAPPIAVGSSIYLVGECPAPIEVPPHQELLACMRVVTPLGADLAYVAVHGVAPEFAAEPGTQDVWAIDDKAIRWRRGERAVAIDLLTGAAKPVADVAPPPVHVAWKKRAWDIRRVVDAGHADDTDPTDPHGAIVATDATTHAQAWATKHPYSQLVGAVYLPEQSPMVRVLRTGPFGGVAEVDVLDIDATGSLHGQAAFPVPGIATLATAASSIGDVAMVVRLDATLTRDYVAGYAANALLVYTWALPQQLRPDAVGVAVAPEAVVVFHDGDTVTILPELSAPPTAPGAARAPLQIPTP